MQRMMLTYAAAVDKVQPETFVYFLRLIFARLFN
jgi:hypothetical protein